jgi:outer membrane protein TolC
LQRRWQCFTSLWFTFFMHKLRLSVLALALATPALYAQQAPGGNLTLQEAVGMAVEKNLQLRIQRFEPLIASESVTVQDSAFDVQLNGSASAGTAKAPLTGVERSTGGVSAGVSKLVSTGGTVSLNTTLDHDNYYTSSSDATGIGLSFTQPLLRGAWADVTLAELRKSRSTLNEAHLQLRGDTLDLILTVSSDYWNLSYAYGRRDLLQSSVNAATKLVEETEAKAMVGLATDIDLLQARASLSDKKAALTDAELAIAKSGDELAQSMGTLLDMQGTSFRPAVASLPQDYSTAPEFESLWPVILAEDTDTLVQEEKISRADIDRVVARSDRRPQLDLTLSAGVDGAGDNEHDAYRSLHDRDGNNWSTGMKFSMPFGRRADLARYRQADSRLEQAKIGLISVKQDLYKRARQAWRDVQLGVDRCQSANARVEFQKQALERARVRYDRNLMSFRELLDAQTDYDDACLQQIAAQRDLAIARTTLARLGGTLVASIGIAPQSLPQSVTPSR